MACVLIPYAGEQGFFWREFSVPDASMVDDIVELREPADALVDIR